MRRIPIPLLLALCAAPAAAMPGGVEMADLIRAIEEIRVGHEVPAVGLTLVSAEEVLWAGALGITDVITGTAVTEETVFRIGSITKSFTALAVLLACEEGALAIEDPVRSLTPDAPYTNRWADSHPVRIAHLLEHTAGFYDLSGAEFDHSDATPASLATALAFEPASRTAMWPPGRYSSYSNSGAGLVALVLETVSEQRYEDFVERRIFAPLGMESAGFFLDGPTRAALATGYQADGRTVIPYWHMIFRAFGGISVSAPDMAPFLQLLLGRGEYAGQRVLSEGSIRRMEHPATTLAAKSGLEFGYGLGNRQWSRDGFVFHGHGGDADGYLAHYGYNLDTGLGYFVVITAFNHRPLRAMREVLEEHIIAGRRAPRPITDSVPQTVLQGYVGEYREVTRRFRSHEPAEELDVVLEDGILYTRFGSRRRALVPVSDTQFRRSNESVATSAFVTDERGDLFLQGHVGNYRRTRGPAPTP